MKKASETRKVHFVGIGGIGASSLAQWFLAQNWLVSGSDLVKSSISSKLQKLGVKVKIGHKTSNLPRDACLVIYSIAVPQTNPELQKARKLGIKTLTWEQMLGELTIKYPTLAVAGTHGKSTTTAMLAAILEKAGFDPTVILGSQSFFSRGKEKVRTNFRLGRGPIWVIEADEYRDHFLAYCPYAAAITNIELDHLDYFKNLSAVKKSFLKFTSQISSQGFAVLNRDDRVSISLEKQIKRKIVWFSLKDKPRANILKKILKVPGEHNISNALAAWAFSENLGVKKEIILKALSEFRGIWRRLEYRGRNPEGFRVFDDYAHHPTEIKASLAALREKFPQSCLISVFQPHQAARLEGLFDKFIAAFNKADSLILLDAYEVAGRDRVSQNINSALLAAKISASKQIPVSYLPSPKKLPSEIRKHIVFSGQKPENAIVIMMGAGDIVLHTPLLLK